jgi:hypothetical protein
MPVNVNGFKGSFADFGRANRFMVQITRLDGNKMKFHCKSASLPGSVIEAIAVPYMGRQIKIAGDRTYEDWNVTIMLDKTYQIRQDLYDWHEQINATEGNTGPGSVSAYKSEAMVQALAIDGSVSKTYKFVGMFPTNVGAVEFSADSNNTVSECAVALAYDYYLPS